MNIWRAIVARVARVEEIFLPFGIDGSALSDFEKLSVFCDLVPMCRGLTVCEEALNAAHELSDVSADGEEKSASELWMRYNELCGCEPYEKADVKYETCQPYCVEKYNFQGGVELTRKTCAGKGGYAELVRRTKQSLRGGYITVRMGKEKFSPPNRYIAEGVYNKLKKDEKCNNNEINCLFSQLLCEILCDKKCNIKGILLDVRYSPEYALEFIGYLHRHNMRGRIFVGVGTSAPVELIANICARSTADALITPIIFMRKNDNAIENKRFLDALAGVYPIGLADRVWE